MSAILDSFRSAQTGFADVYDRIEILRGSIAKVPDANMTPEKIKRTKSDIDFIMVTLKKALNMIRADVEQCIEAIESCEAEADGLEESDDFEGLEEFEESDES